MINFLRKIDTIHVIILIFGIYLFSFYNRWHNYDEKFNFQFSNDVATYYSYLPSLFLNNDPFFEEHVQPASYLDLEFGEHRGVKYTIGMSIMYSPFFLVAWLTDPMTAELAEYGLTKTFSHSIRIGCILYFLIGLFFLLKLCNRYFSKSTLILSSILILFGTNLLHYTVVEGEMPHVHIFFLLGVILYTSEAFWRTKKNKYLFILSAFVSLAALIRPTEIILILIPLLWGINSWSDIMERVHYIRNKYMTFLLAFFIALLIFLPQIIYWKLLSGNFLLYSYSDERFFFNDPKVMSVLFSFRKGWYTYTPIMLIATIGMLYVGKYMREAKILIPLILALVVFLNASWWCWWMAGSFGARNFVQYYPLMFIALCALIEKIQMKNLRAYGIMIAFFAFLVHLNMDLTKKYSAGKVSPDSMTRESYFFVLQHDLNEKSEFESYHNLLQKPDYSAAKIGHGR